MRDETNVPDKSGANGNAETPAPERNRAASSSQPGAPVEVTVGAKLEQINELCEIGDFDRARPLLYDVLSDGDSSQVDVAMAILARLDA